jgi:hypothetical protein
MDQYRQWLASHGEEHRHELLRHWLKDVYCPGPMRAEMAWIQPPPTRVAVGEIVTARVRCTNTSNETWTMLPSLNAGVHLIWRVQDDQRKVIAAGQAGLFEKTVPPGGSVDLLIATPPLEVTGRLVLRAGMDNPRHSTFAQVGNEILEAFVEAVPQGAAHP